MAARKPPRKFSRSRVRRMSGPHRSRSAAGGPVPPLGDTRSAGFPHRGRTAHSRRRERRAGPDAASVRRARGRAASQTLRRAGRRARLRYRVSAGRAAACAMRGCWRCCSIACSSTPATARCAWSCITIRRRGPRSKRCWPRFPPRKSSCAAISSTPWRSWTSPRLPTSRYRSTSWPSIRNASCRPSKF